MVSHAPRKDRYSRSSMLSLKKKDQEEYPKTSPNCSKARLIANGTLNKKTFEQDTMVSIANSLMNAAKNDVYKHEDNCLMTPVKKRPFLPEGLANQLPIPKFNIIPPTPIKHSLDLPVGSNSFPETNHELLHTGICACAMNRPKGVVETGYDKVLERQVRRVVKAEETAKEETKLKELGYNLGKAKGKGKKAVAYIMPRKAKGRRW